MQAPAFPEDEAARQTALERLFLLSTPLEERFERVTRLARRLFQAPICAFTLIDGRRQWFKSEQGLGIAETPREASFCGHAILSDETLIVADALQDVRFQDNPLVTGRPHIRFYAGQPVHSPDGHRIGTLCVMDSQPRQFGKQEIEDLRDLTVMLELELRNNALATAQIQIISELADARREAMIDPLTRVWNRAGMEQLLAQRFARAHVQMRGFHLAMMDLDHFKQINDRHGHEAGDFALREVVRRTLSALRPIDAIGRMGGEEFLLLIEETDAAGAYRVAQQTREAVRSAPVDFPDGVVPLTVSIGLARYQPGNGATLESVIRRADKALYAAKQSGRDCVFDEGVVK